MIKTYADIAKSAELLKKFAYDLEQSLKSGDPEDLGGGVRLVRVGSDPIERIVFVDLVSSNFPEGIGFGFNWDSEVDDTLNERFEKMKVPDSFIKNVFDGRH